MHAEVFQCVWTESYEHHHNLHALDALLPEEQPRKHGQPTLVPLPAAAALCTRLGGWQGAFKVSMCNLT